MRVGIYARVSTEEQAKGYSLEVQVEECVRYCLERGWAYEVFRDIESGVVHERQGFLELRKALLGGKIKGVVVWRFDRLSRDFLQAMNFLSEVKKTEGFLVSVREGEISLTGGVEEFIKLIAYFGFPSIEWHAIRERARAGKLKKMQEGKYMGGDTLGQTKDGKVKEEETLIVRRIFQLYLDGYGIGKIAKVLNREKALGKEWSVRTVRYILRRPYYAGIIIPNANKRSTRSLLESLYKGEYYVVKDIEPIIDLDTYRLVLEKFSRADKERGRSKIAHEFSGLLRCASCGSGVRLSSSKNYYAIKCNRYTDGRCDMKVNFRLFRQRFLERLPDILQDFRTSVLEAWQEEREKLERDRELKLLELKQREQKIKQVIEKYLEDYEKGILTGQVVAERIRKRQEELEEVKMEIRRLEQEEFHLPPIEQILEYFDLLVSHWDSLPVEEKNSLLREVFNEIRVGKDHFVLVFFDNTEEVVKLSRDQRHINLEGLSGIALEVAKLWLEGKSLIEIAQKLDLSYSRVKYILKKAREGSVPVRGGWTFSRKKDLYREKVLDLHRQGLSHKQIARRLGVSDSLVIDLLLQEKRKS
ncbi:MAG: recombinase family protein [Aquificaceae bacterium]